MALNTHQNYTLTGQTPDKLNGTYLYLTGNGNLDSTGNALNNLIVGTTGTNRLNGEDGNDTLIGGGGSDELHGGAGIGKHQGA